MTALIVSLLAGRISLPFLSATYFAHAATVKLYPGESALPTLLAVVCSLLFPPSGLVRGLNGIVRHARIRKKNPKSDYQTAAAAGALCMVVRTKSWRPCAGDKILDIVLRGKCKDGKFLNIINQPDEGQQVTEKKLKVYSPPWAHELGRFWQYIDTWGVRVGPSRTINGSYDLNGQSYALAYVPTDAEVVSAKTPADLIHPCDIERGETEEITPATATAIEKPTATLERRGSMINKSSQPVIVASYSPLKAIIAILQLIYAITTLYKSRGNQIAVYGFAAFGLTVIPYALMSFVNLVSGLVTPEYSALFMVGSDVMDEAIRRGAKFDGVVGRLVLDPQPTTPKETPTATVLSAAVGNVTVQEFLYEYKKEESRFPVTITDYSTPTNIKSIAEDLNPSVFAPSCSKFRRADYTKFDLDINKTLMTDRGLFSFSYRYSKATSRGATQELHFFKPFFKYNITPAIAAVVIANALVVLAVILCISYYYPGSSPIGQPWIMLWYTCSLSVGVIPIVDKLDAIKTGVGERKRVIAVLSFILLIYSTPPIGGFVVVAQMLKAYGRCTITS